MKFEALINAVHIDPKKGSVKIVLDAASHVSLDELTTLSPKDETIQVTFERAQTRLDDVVDPNTPDPEIAKRYEEEAERIRRDEETEEKEGKIITEFLTPNAPEVGDD